MRRSAALAVVLLLALAACRDDPSTIDVADEGPAISLCAFLGIELEVEPDEPEVEDGVTEIVFLEPDATDEQRAAVEELLSGYESVEFVDQDATYEEFAELFADDPAVVEPVTPDLLPSSFRVARSEGEPPVDVVALGELAGVREVVVLDSERDEDLDAPTSVGHALVALWHPVRHDVVVYFQPDAGPDDFAPVVAALDELGAGVTLVSQEDAYLEFSRLFADEPELLATVTPEILPASARVDVPSRFGAGQLGVSPGVREVTFTYQAERVNGLIDALGASPEVADTLGRVDDPLAADVAVLDAAARRWAVADPVARTRGSVFAEQERVRAAEAAGRVAAASVQDCDVNLATAQRPGAG